MYCANCEGQTLQNKREIVTSFASNSQKGKNEKGKIKCGDVIQRRHSLVVHLSRSLSSLFLIQPPDNEMIVWIPASHSNALE